MNCLIVKLLGGKIGYKTLQTKVTSLWNQKGELSLVELGECYYLAKFILEEDRQFALSEGPRVIFGHYLTLKRWRPDFLPSEAVIESTPAWIRFPELPVEYSNERVLLAMEKTIGRAVKVYTTTHVASRVKLSIIKGVC